MGLGNVFCRQILVGQSIDHLINQFSRRNLGHNRRHPLRGRLGQGEVDDVRVDDEDTSVEGTVSYSIPPYFHDQEVWISKASSEQRKGRAGRTGPGCCYRMYSQSDYDKFESYTSSEIHRVSLQSVAMQIYNLDLGGELRGLLIYAVRVVQYHAQNTHTTVILQ